MRAPTREDGYAPIADYSAIGDGRALALVGLDGSVDWLCLPALDAPPVLAALLDPERGGSFVLAPRGVFHTDRRYIDETNVLETVFTTETGSVKVTEALQTEGGALLPWTELVRKVECLDGSVELEWRLTARPRWGTEEIRTSVRDGIGLVEWDGDGITVLSFGAGTPKAHGDAVHGSFELEEGEDALLAALYFDDEPFAAPSRSELQVRLERTILYWQSYTRNIPYAGPWQGAVRRSVLALRLLTDERTGAIVAAPTTSLPERVGGDRNWDYRFSWVRDTALALESLLAVRLTVQCHRSFAWVVEAASSTAPHVQPMYALDGSPDLPREDIPFAGYLGSQPVRVGNDAQDQLQLGGYADIIEAAYRYCGAGHLLNDRTAEFVAGLASTLCTRWSEEDAGIWEIAPRHYTESKVASWSGLDRAIELAENGKIPDDDIKRWRSSRDEVREWIDAHCWSEERQTYLCYPGAEGLDASLLLIPRFGFLDANDARFVSTRDAIRRELADGPFLYRFSDARGIEGCFLACSFWLVDALARGGQLDEAHALMDELLAAGNDSGLYAEEIDASTRAHLGNFPQALTHLSLILAAVSVQKAERAMVGN